MITLVMTYTLSLPLWALQIPFNVCIAMAGLLCPPCPRKSSSPQRPLTCLTRCHSRPNLLFDRAYRGPWRSKRRPTEPARAQWPGSPGLGRLVPRPGWPPQAGPSQAWPCLGLAGPGPGLARARPRGHQLYGKNEATQWPTQ